MISKIIKYLRAYFYKIFYRARISVYKFLGKSDISRWQQRDKLLTRWDERTKLLASYIPPNSKVLEFGSGRLILPKYLPEGCYYYNSDIVQRDENTIVIDLNKSRPNLPEVDVIVFSGVLEYVKDMKGLLNHCMQFTKIILFSYSTVQDYPSISQRRSWGWINDFSEEELQAIECEPNIEFSKIDKWNKQGIFKITK